MVTFSYGNINIHFIFRGRAKYTLAKFPLRIMKVTEMSELGREEWRCDSQVQGTSSSTKITDKHGSLGKTRGEEMFS